MYASRVVKWGAVAVLLLAVSAFAMAGVGAAQGHSGGHGKGPSGPTYSVTFQETGLAAGTNWTVSLSGHGGWGWGLHRHLTSNTSSIVFSLTNGTYRFSVSNVRGYQIVNDSHGYVVVSGASPAAISVVFAKLYYYPVTFSETGLASGTHWFVRVATVGPWGHLRGSSRGSAGTTITLKLLNGSYAYRVLPVPGYTIKSGGAGTFNVTGAPPPTIDVVFAALPTYAVTFTETGLPAGTNWSVAVLSWGGGAEFARSNQTSITFDLWNGTYLYHIGHVPGYYVSGGAFGTFNVTGASPPVIDVTFVAGTWGNTYPTPLLSVA